MHIFKRVIARIGSQKFRAEVDASRDHKKRHMSIDVESVKSFIGRHVKDLRGPQDVAARLGLSYHTLRIQFRRQEGVTLGKFLAQARIAQAKQLLITTDLLCFEVSYEAGFTREDVAAKIFKAHTGLTMQTYRRLHAGRTDTAARLDSETMVIENLLYHDSQS